MTAPAQAIVFTGHMIDAPGRENPRFPPWMERSARRAIGDAVRRLLTSTPGNALGIAGGASGGDILFHEVCAELRVPTRMLLTRQPDSFVDESVAPAGPDWVRRFHALLSSHSDSVKVLEEDPNSEQNIWEQANRWILEEALSTGASTKTLIALWDGRSGDGPGGTRHLLELASEKEIATEVIDTTALGQTASDQQFSRMERPRRLRGRHSNREIRRPGS